MVLLAQGKQVTVINRGPEVGKELELYIKPYTFGLIEREQVPILTNTSCLEIGDGFVLVEKDGRREKIACEAVVLAVGSQSNTKVVEPVQEMGIEHYVVGDAVKPTNVLDAIWGANEIARKI